MRKTRLMRLIRLRRLRRQKCRDVGVAQTVGRVKLAFIPYDLLHSSKLNAEDVSEQETTRGNQAVYQF